MNSREILKNLKFAKCICKCLRNFKGSQNFHLFEVDMTFVKNRKLVYFAKINPHENSWNTNFAKINPRGNFVHLRYTMIISCSKGL